VLIFHVATEADWAAAQRSGEYTTSTRDRTLEDEGFVHAAFAHQWRGVVERYYADVDHGSLLLLEIDTDLLLSPVREEPGQPGGVERFPHVHGPVRVAAVVRAVPLAEALADTSFSELFLREVLRNALLGMLVVAGAAVGLLIGDALAADDGGTDWTALAGALLGGGLAAAGALSWSRRRS